MLLLINCKYKILSEQPRYQKLVSVSDDKPSKQSNGNTVDIEVKGLGSKVMLIITYDLAGYTIIF